MADPGDEVYLGSILSNVHCWGIVSDIDSPAGTSATFEILGNDGAVTMDALVGPQGPAGENAAIVKMQYGSSIDDPGDLPDNLTDDGVDLGITYWIGNQVYMWSGTQLGWVAKAMGSQGPPGPLPDVTPTVQLLDPDDVNLTSEIVVSGTAASPTWLMKLKAPRGPRGYNATIRDATDYTELESGAPEVGDVIQWNGADYEPAQVGSILPKFYSVPEANFQNYAGLTTRQTICTFQVPVQEWGWVPWVTGHIRAVGLEADTDPLILGCEVRLGDAQAGVLIGRGFGNSSTWTTIVPHFSTTQGPNDATSPDNGVAHVPANHTGSAGTVFVNLFNDGLTGAYAFNAHQAQLGIMVIPVTPLGT